MPDRSNVIYRSDGSFDGLLCCVFESFARRELPAAILTGAEEQCSLLPVREIPTDPQKAARVRASIPGRLGAATGRLIESAFLYGGEGRELAILELMRAGYRLGPRVASMLDLPEVQTVFSMRRAETKRITSPALSVFRKSAARWCRSSLRAILFCRSWRSISADASARKGFCSMTGRTARPCSISPMQRRFGKWNPSNPQLPIKRSCVSGECGRITSTPQRSVHAQIPPAKWGICPSGSGPISPRCSGSRISDCLRKKPF